MKYFMLISFGPRDEDRATVTDVSGATDVDWNTGDAIDPARLPSPFPLELDTSEGSALVPMFYPGILVLRDDMVAALRGAGVDNLQVFDAVIEDRERARRLTNYKVVNIVGRVACADLGKSEHVVHGSPVIDVDFDSLVIADDKTYDLDVFRLAECVSGIVVSERARRALDGAGVGPLEFVPPEEWVG
jgi:hypothetical protein